MQQHSTIHNLVYVSPLPRVAARAGRVETRNKMLHYIWSGFKMDKSNRTVADIVTDFMEQK